MIDVNVFVAPAPASVLDVGARLGNDEGPVSHSVGLNERGPMADHHDRLTVVDEGPDERDSLLVHPQPVRIRDSLKPCGVDR